MYSSTRPERRRPQGSREQARTLREQKKIPGIVLLDFAQQYAVKLRFARSERRECTNGTRPIERRQQGARSPIVQSKTHSQIHLYHRRVQPLTTRKYVRKSIKKDSNHANDLSLKKIPASCYSPIVKFTVPSPLKPLTTVFGKGTCVSAPLWTPEIYYNKENVEVTCQEKITYFVRQRTFFS